MSHKTNNQTTHVSDNKQPQIVKILQKDSTGQAELVEVTKVPAGFYRCPWCGFTGKVDHSMVSISPCPKCETKPIYMVQLQVPTVKPRETPIA